MNSCRVYLTKPRKIVLSPTPIPARERARKSIAGLTVSYVVFCQLLDSFHALTTPSKEEAILLINKQHRISLFVINKLEYYYIANNDNIREALQLTLIRHIGSLWLHTMKRTLLYLSRSDFSIEYFLIYGESWHIIFTSRFVFRIK